MGRVYFHLIDGHKLQMDIHPFQRQMLYIFSPLKPYILFTSAFSQWTTPLSSLGSSSGSRSSGRNPLILSSVIIGTVLPSLKLTAEGKSLVCPRPSAHVRPEYHHLWKLSIPMVIYWIISISINSL